MKQLAQDTQNKYIIPDEADYYDQDMYESFKEGYISLRMKGWTHEEAYNNIKNQFETQEDGKQRFETITQDQNGNDRYCNRDQYGCWVTEEDGRRSYIMFWSEEAKNFFIGKDKTAVVCDPLENYSGRMPTDIGSVSPVDTVSPAQIDPRFEAAPDLQQQENDLPISKQ